MALMAKYNFIFSSKQINCSAIIVMRLRRTLSFVLSSVLHCKRTAAWYPSRCQDFDGIQGARDSMW